MSIYLRRHSLWGLYPDLRVPLPRGQGSDLVQELIKAGQDVVSAAGFVGYFPEHLSARLDFDYSYSLSYTVESLYFVHLYYYRNYMAICQLRIFSLHKLY